MNKRFAVAGVHATTPLATAAPALLLSKAEPLFALEDAARGGADMDAVHDMRVASRRLREAMRLLKPLYRGRAFDRWYRRVRRITRALGPVRDSDVFIDAFSSLGDSLGTAGGRAVAFLVGHRMGQRQHELVALNAELAGLDLERNRRTFEKMARSIADAPAAREPLSAFAHAAVAERAAVVFGSQPLALRVENIAQQHELRIDYKRLRYAVEVLAPCYDDFFDPIHDTLTGFQDALGDLHDAHVFIEVLRAPEHRAQTQRAGVSGEGLAEVEAELGKRASAAFSRFTSLVAAHPPDALLPQLLLPLTRIVVPASDVTVEPPEAGEPGELHVAAPVIVGDEPWAEGWDEAEVSADEVPVAVSEDATALPD